MILDAGHYLSLGGVLFALSVGIFLNRKNLIMR